MYRNTCTKCKLVESLIAQLSNLDEENDAEKIYELRKKIEQLENHTCLQNFVGPSRSMETDTIIQIVKIAPVQLKAYVRVLVMDDDQTARSNIQEDLGPKSKGCLPGYLAGIRVLADPSHRKKVITNWYFKLVSKPVAECALNKEHAKKLGKHFGYFQMQIKNMSMEDAKKQRVVPMQHIIGNHANCNPDWCLAKRAQDEGKPFTEPPMFDMDKDRDKRTYLQVKSVHEKATTDEKLVEMHHHFTTQPSESLNMRAAEVAPKWKNYSRTEALDYRIDMVVGQHNMGCEEYYDHVFDDAGIVLEEELAKTFAVRDGRKEAKKKRDSSIAHKCKRVHKFEAKLKEKLFLEKQGASRWALTAPELDCRRSVRTKNERSWRHRKRRGKNVIAEDFRSTAIRIRSGAFTIQNITVRPVHI